MRRLILAGGGHAHLQVLRALATQRPRDVEIILIAPCEYSLYSGMLPGWMAGHYELSECRIDLRPSAAAAGVRLIVSEVGCVDARRRRVALGDGTLLEYDLLSLNVGGESNLSFVESISSLVLPVRPLTEFVRRWPAVIEAAATQGKFRLIVIGGGAGGVELAFAAAHALSERQISAEVTLVAGAGGLLRSHTPRAASLARRLLASRGVTVFDALAVGVEEGVVLSSGELLKADCVIAATGSRAPCWLRLSHLALDDHGYVQVNARHQSVSHANVFAAGDVCLRIDVPLAHSGVHAVRAGRVIAANLLAALSGGAPRSYRPRRNPLYILATGPKHAIASWGPFSALGYPAWLLKDWIDKRFVSGFAQGAMS
jgi:pyridine nucleotide-disulfide oxidoreductase family protein